jgi:hypothetical protein
MLGLHGLSIMDALYRQDFPKLSNVERKKLVRQQTYTTV